jgi:hypothetical protein
MEGSFKRLRFRGRSFSQSEFQLIKAFGTEAAWLKAAQGSSDPERWEGMFKALRPWARKKPNLLRLVNGQPVLISQVYVRVPDVINGLTEAKVVRIPIDIHKNILVDQTEWIDLSGNQSADKSAVTFPQKRGYGQPRKKAIPF